MDEKLAQFQEEVRLGLEEVAAKALKKARYDNSCVSYSIPLVSFLRHLLPADLVASSDIIIHFALRVLFSCVVFIVGFIFRGFYFSCVCSPHEN